MRKLFSLLAAVLFAGSMMAAESVAYKLEPAAGTNNAYANNCDIEINGVTWNLTGNSTMIPWRIGGKNLDGVDRELYSKTPIAANVSKIAIEHGEAKSVTVNSMTVFVASDASFENVISELHPTFEASKTVTVERPSGADWSNAFYKFVYNITVGKDNKFIQFVGATFYTDGEGGDPVTPPAGDEVELDVAYAEAYYLSEYDAWELNLYKDYNESTGETTYPDVYVDFFAKSATALAGTYNADDEMAYAVAFFAEEDSVEAASFSDMVIEYKGEGLYAVKLSFVADDAKTYVIDWEGEIAAYDEEYNEIELNEGGDPVVPGDLATTGVHTLTPVKEDAAGAGSYSTVIDGIQLDWEGAYYETDFRAYANKSITITAGGNIVKVEIAGLAKKDLAPTVNHGTITTGASFDAETTKATIEDPLIVIEEIGAKSVTITCNKQLQARIIRVTLDGATAIDNTEATVKAVKTIENGVLIIEKNGVRYNVYGAQVR